MATLTVKPIEREFFIKEKNLILPDPNPELTPEAVLTFLAMSYPELLTATITEPQYVGEKMRFTCKTVLGTKG